MKYRAVITYSQGALLIGTNGSVAPLNDHETVDSAKAQVAKYINGNKASFQNGYDVFIVDLTTGLMAASATQPVPTLAWKDSK
jgi:hypothetical protein